jgi:diguanylate cyclase (GGDEF)-like protein
MQRMTRSLTLLFAFVVTLVCSCALALAEYPAAAMQLREQGVNLSAVLYLAGDHVPPKNGHDQEWAKQKTRAAKVDLSGGAYWLDSTFTVDATNDAWTLVPSRSLMEHVDLWVFEIQSAEETPPPLHFQTGYYAPYEHFMSYARNVKLATGHRYRVVARIESRYFAADPKLEILPQALFQHHHSVRNAIALGSFGALLVLALYNLFVFASTRDRTLLYYALYLITYALSWASNFHLLAHLGGVYGISLLYVGFFLLPVFNVLFYLRFLRLKEFAPRLAKLSWACVALALLCLPSAFFAHGKMHLLASLILAVWILLALLSGIVCWRKGYRPARYFVFAFVAVLVPGVLVLPSNLLLLPRIVQDAEIVSLMGGVLDALLLAFALADRIRVLESEKDQYVKELDQALDAARTDALTALGNRFAFDECIVQAMDSAKGRGNQEAVLFLIDLDGLKTINDGLGHNRGDALLVAFASALKKVCLQGASCYRLGGDEFTLLAKAQQASNLSSALEGIEKELRAVFPQSGVSFGMCHLSEITTGAELVGLADRRMYLHKETKRAARVARELRNSSRPPALSPESEAGRP